MSNLDLMLEAFDKREQRRLERRRLFKLGGGFAVGAAAGAVLGACSSSAGDAIAQAPPAPDNDPAILNFALNLEYLEAQFYSYATFGTGLAAASLTGVGTQGGVTATGAGMVPFTDPVVRNYAREIANDEVNHVNFLRSALGSTVWTVTGTPDDSGRMVYRLAGVFTPSEVRPESDGFGITGEGTPFRPPIDVTAEPWFAELLREQSNFSFGFSRIRGESIVAELQRLFHEHSTHNAA